MSSKSKKKTKYVKKLKPLGNISEDKILSLLPEDALDSLGKRYLEKQKKKIHTAVVIFKYKYVYFNVNNLEIYKFLVDFFDELSSSSKYVKKILLKKIDFGLVFLDFHTFIKENEIPFEGEVGKLIGINFSTMSEVKRNRKHITLKNTSILINAIIEEYEDDLDSLNDMDNIIEKTYLVFSNGFNVEQSREMIIILNRLDPIYEGIIYATDFFKIIDVPKYSYIGVLYNNNDNDKQRYRIIKHKDLAKGIELDDMDDRSGSFFMYQFK